jgi:hypothetical protein
LIVFGRGLDREEGGVLLSRASAVRVHAAVDHVREHLDLFSAPGANPKRIVFSGGWAEAAAGMAAPPAGSREGDLMRDLALREPVDAGRLDDYAEICVETESRSTLENLLNVVRLGYIDPVVISRSNPLGLVAHRGHLRRIAFLAKKVLDVRPDEIQRVPAEGRDAGSGGIPEWAVYVVTRLLYAGTSKPASLLRRERSAVRLVGAVTRRGR